MEEPDIIINGYKLNTAQSMTVRVAINNLMIDLSKSSHETDLLYKERIKEIINFMVQNSVKI